ncbi:SMC family ATPase [Dehalococcoidia bacterium]|nr:SMC family ATPase [Dehalococcoidia bacterium]
MIPLKLALRNFMCYRDNTPPLDFSGIHVACLCGDNGNGKSALLDAMTWALWGESRAKSDDDLIHQGQSEMEVEFEFLVGPVRYRVIRKRTKSRSRRPGQTVLEFQVRHNGSFKSVSGNTVRETERKIRDTLRMDYQTFINSAFLVQGRAAEFTIKTPGERKRVLGEILGLSIYDDLEERARELGREREREKERLESNIADIERELRRKTEYEEEFQGVQASIAEIEGHLRSQEANLANYREARKDLDLKNQELTEVMRRIGQAKEESNYWERQIKGHQARIKEHEAILAGRIEIEEGYAQLITVQKENDALNDKLSRLMSLSQSKNEIERLIARAEADLAAEQRVARSKVKELESRVQAKAVVAGELKKAEARLEEITSWEEELGQKRTQVEEISGRIHHLKSANKMLEEEIKSLRDKVNLLTPEASQCPLCEAELGEEGRERILANYKAEGRARTESYQSNKKELQERAAEQQALRNTIAQMEIGINKERAAGQARRATLEREILEIEKAALDLVPAQIQLAQLEEKLQKRDFALAERARLSQVETEIADLGYGGEHHKRVRQRLSQLSKYEGQHQKLGEAERGILQEKESLERARGAIGRWGSLLVAETRRQATLSEELKVLPEITSKLAEAERGYNSLQEQRHRAGQRLGAVQQQLDHCAALERLRAEKGQALRQAAEEKNIYDELVMAFGKKGIQALIIETALPEIQGEANKLLARMTDGRMGVEIESQRSTKKGETIETLDINIRDELGTRSYEMYSGGESFRIDLALRIALSRLLARRAGAPLPTLIIDEGFGTQDASGRGKLVEAINSIQDDFERIIVITHIDELKDAFPVRIEVTRTNEGSTIAVS